jgi:molecular chaperone GrpE
MADKKQAETAMEMDSAPEEATDEGGGEAGPAEPATGTEERLKALAHQLEDKEKEYRETLDQLLRVSAEFENYKKRSAREQEEFRKYANQSLLKEMLSAVDHIELAIKAAEGGAGPQGSLAEGLNLTLKELMRIFEKFGVTAIEAQGQPFNPEFHEAMLREESLSLPANTVARELQKGYMIGKRLLRPSLVVVSSPPAER